MLTLLEDVEDLIKQTYDIRRTANQTEKSYKDCIAKLEEEKTKLNDIARTKYISLNDQVGHLFQASSMDLSKFLNDNWNSIITANKELILKREKENEELNIRVERYKKSLAELEVQFAELKVKHCNLESKYNFISNSTLSNKFHKNLKHKYERAIEDLSADRQLIGDLTKQIEGMSREMQTSQAEYTNCNREIRQLRDQLFKEQQAKANFFITMKENCYNLLKESMAKEKTDAGISSIKDALDSVTKQSREQCESLSKQLKISNVECELMRQAIQSLKEDNERLAMTFKEYEIQTELLNNKNEALKRLSIGARTTLLQQRLNNEVYDFTSTLFIN